MNLRDELSSEMSPEFARQLSPDGTVFPLQPGQESRKVLSSGKF